MSLDLDRLGADVEAALLSRGGARNGSEILIRCLRPESHRNGDQTPSASYSPDRKAWYCHACGAGGGLATGDDPIVELLGLDLDGYSANGNGKRKTPASSPTGNDEDAGARARRLWESAREPDPSHPYLGRKGVKAHGLRQQFDLLVVPMYGPDGALRGLQYIDGSGGKNFLGKSAKKGSYHPLGRPDGAVIVAEGYATAATIHEATGTAVACAFDAGNLLPVAEALRAKLGTQTQLIIAADDDRGDGENTGIEAATKAARAVGGLVAVPRGLDSKGDFNDLAKALGFEAVRQCLEAATEPEQIPRTAESCAATGCEDAVSVEDFYCYMPMHRYIYSPCRELWPSASVNARLPAIPIGDGKSIAPSAWIAANRPVEQMTWAPGEPMVIRDRLIVEGGWFDHEGVTVFNLYRPPRVERGEPGAAGPWLEHLRRIYQEYAEHLLRWLAHRVQRPEEKVNHAIVLGGAQGIGKDTLLEPVKRAVGPWNFSEVSPTVLLGRFNGYLQAVILRVSEARDLGDVNRFALYDHMKAITAAPPDVLRIDRKNIQEYAIPNVCGVVVTTNHRTDGLYIPSDDRRHYVAWSERVKEDFGESYWAALWGWYETGGYGHVAAYLAGYDLGDFDPKAPPPKTSAWHAIVDAGRSPEEGELADALEELDWPPAIYIDQILPRVTGDFRAWLQDRKNARAVPHRFEEVGYVAARNPGAKDGRWKVGGNKRVIYARQEMTLRDQLAEARRLAGEPREDPDPGREGREGRDSPSSLASTPPSPFNPESAKSAKGERARKEDTESRPSRPSRPEGGYQPLFRSKAEPGLDDGDLIAASEPPSAIEVVREVFAGCIESEEAM